MSWSFHGKLLPLARPYRWAGGAQTERAVLLVRLVEGATSGWGEVAPPPHERVELKVLAAAAAVAVEGIPAGAHFLRAIDTRRIPSRVRAGLTTAWLDLRARQAGVPVAALLGEMAGRRARGTVTVNALVTAEDADGAARQARAATQAGFDTIKIKCTADRAGDLARVAAVRTAAPDAALRLDANGAWEATWAADHLADLATHGIAYVEDPVDGGPAALAAVQDESGVDVAADAGIDGPGAVQEAHAAGLSTLILKPQRLGGADHAALCGVFAETLGMTAVVTNSLESAVGLSAAAHVAAVLGDVACGVGTSGLLAKDVATPPAVASGRMAIRGPGLGVDPW